MVHVSVSVTEMSSYVRVGLDNVKVSVRVLVTALVGSGEGEARVPTSLSETVSVPTGILLVH